MLDLRAAPSSSKLNPCAGICPRFYSFLKIYRFPSREPVFLFLSHCGDRNAGDSYGVSVCEQRDIVGSVLDSVAQHGFPEEISQRIESRNSGVVLIRRLNLRSSRIDLAHGGLEDPCKVEGLFLKLAEMQTVADCDFFFGNAGEEFAGSVPGEVLGQVRRDACRLVPQVGVESSGVECRMVVGPGILRRDDVRVELIEGERFTVGIDVRLVEQAHFRRYVRYQRNGGVRFVGVHPVQHRLHPVGNGALAHTESTLVGVMAPNEGVPSGIGLEELRPVDPGEEVFDFNGEVLDEGVGVVHGMPLLF